MKMACGDPSAAFRIAILDPELTASAPPAVSATAGIDAIAHAVETAVTTRRTPLSDTFSHQAWRLLADGFERVIVHPADMEARAMMQLGAHFAGVAIEQSMLGAAHACANPLTARAGLTHGVALGILLPHVVRWNGPVAVEGYTALLGSPRRRSRDAEAPETLARRIEDFADRRRPAGPAERCRGRRRGAPGACRSRGGAMDGDVQPAALRCGGGAGDLSGGVLIGARSRLR